MVYTHETPCTGSLFGGLNVTNTVQKLKQQMVVTVKVKNRGTFQCYRTHHGNGDWKQENANQTHARHQFQQLSC